MSKTSIPSWIWIPEISFYVSPEALDVVYAAREEVADPRFKELFHGERVTYRKGCTGPLCKKAMRDYGREYQRQRYQHTQVRKSSKTKFDPLVVLLQASYLDVRYKSITEMFRKKQVEPIIADANLSQLRMSRPSLSGASRAG